MAAGTVSPDSSTAVTLRPELARLAARDATGACPSSRAAARRRVSSSSVLRRRRSSRPRRAVASSGSPRSASAPAASGAGGAGLLGAGFGSEASGTDGDRGLAAVASIFVMTMNAVALTARQAVVRMMVFNMASSPSRRGSIRRWPALRKRRATGHEQPSSARIVGRVLDVRRSVKILFCRTPTCAAAARAGRAGVGVGAGAAERRHGRAAARLLELGGERVVGERGLRLLLAAELARGLRLHRLRGCRRRLGRHRAQLLHVGDGLQHDLASDLAARAFLLVRLRARAASSIRRWARASACRAPACPAPASPLSRRRSSRSSASASLLALAVVAEQRAQPDPSAGERSARARRPTPPA